MKTFKATGFRDIDSANELKDLQIKNGHIAEVKSDAGTFSVIIKVKIL